VVELLGNGSAFLRVSPPEVSDDDVYISAAQVRRCELVFRMVDEVVAGIAQVEAGGEGQLAQLFDLILVGDLTSLQMALNEGIDPGPAPGVNIAYWGPEIRVGVPQPALSINMDAATNVESLSFSFDGRARTQMTVTITEPNTKISIPVPIPDIGLLRPPLALRPAVALRQVPVPDTAKLTTIGAALVGLAMTAQASDAISGQGRLDVLRYGHILRARRLVSVRGASLAYDGFFYVKSVTHDIKRGEYKQSFTLARDGLVSQTPVVNT